MNDQAESWVWGYADTVRNFCKKYFPRDPQILEDMTHNILLRISQRDGLDQVGDRSKWMRTVALHECMDYFRELKRNRDRAMVADENLSTLEEVENETDESEKIDPMKVWHSFKRHDPEKAMVLYQSFWFVQSAFNQILGQRRFYMDCNLCDKALADLRDITKRLEKNSPSEKYFGRSPSLFIYKQIRELAQRTVKEFGDFGRGIKLFFYDSRFPPLGSKSWFHSCYVPGPLDFILAIPDPLYVLYRIWNQILKKGRKGKYGNRKLLETLLFAFKKIEQNPLNILSSLTEEKNLETLRVMSYQLNKAYSSLADFIYRVSVHPPKKKTLSTRPH